MGWLWRADADGGADGEETPRRRELPDDTAPDMEQWEGSNAAPPEGIVTGNSEFEANRFDMVRPITQERLGLLFDSEGRPVWAVGGASVLLPLPRGLSRGAVDCRLHEEPRSDRIR